MPVLLKDMKRKPCPVCGCNIGEEHKPQCRIERVPNEKWSGIEWEAEIKVAEENDWWVYYDRGWHTCTRDYPKATQDVTKALSITMNIS